MNSTHQNSLDIRLLDALRAEDSSTRLQAALAAGTRADPDLLDALVTRCAVEPDFFVRDMLTWALTRLPAETTVPRLLGELHSDRTQAQSQALHTLSKIGDADTWRAIPRSLLHDRADEVARSAWRAAVVLAPVSERDWLAAELAKELGRGDWNLRRSLSRALVALGEVTGPVLRVGLASKNPKVRDHARATKLLLLDPEAAFYEGIAEAKRVDALGPDR